MPNWYKTFVTAEGSETDLARIMTTHIVPSEIEGEELMFDLNTIVPMPEILKGSESSSEVRYSLYLLGRQDIDTCSFGKLDSEQMMTYSWVQEAGVKTEDELKELLRKRHPYSIEKAKHAIACYEATGHVDWHSWSLANWGTKWNTFRLHLEKLDGELDFSFETAWAPPEPVLHKLREMYPSVEFKFEGYDADDYDYERGPELEVVAAP
jgi:hypothetical protein